MNYIFLTIGKTKDSAEVSEGFKRYIGVGSSYVVAVNPTKEELEKIEGREITNMPEYVVDGENGKEARVMFVVKTDPEANNGIEITQRMMYTLRMAPAYNRDQTKVRVKDMYGNFTWADTDDAKAGVRLPDNTRIDHNHYSIACQGEYELVTFLKTYLCVPNVLNYLNGAWTVRENAEEGAFSLDEIKNYFSGDFSEIKHAISLQPNNKLKLLYGIRTNDENKQFQTVATGADYILRNSAGASALNKLEKTLADAKARGSFQNTEFEVCELKEYEVQPTNLESNTSAVSNEMPWD